jgi:hypothetical protein
MHEPRHEACEKIGARVERVDFYVLIGRVGLID